MSKEFCNALSLFRQRNFEECTNVCTEILRKTPLDKVNYLITNFFEFRSYLFLLLSPF